MPDHSEIFRELFREDTREQLAGLEKELMSRDMDDSGDECLASIFRTYHTIKGSAGMYGYPEITAYAHEIESALDPLRKRKAGLPQELVDPVLAAGDCILFLLGNEETGDQEQKRNSITRNIRTLIDRAVSERKDVRVEEQGQQERKQDTTNPAGNGSFIRVRSENLDSIMNIAEEFIVLGSSLPDTGKQLPDRAQFIQFREEYRRLVRELGALVFDMRLLPLSGTFGAFTRLVHSLNGELGKNITLFMEGEDTELDRAIIERLKIPLIHLIRNAADHGIEFSPERELKGKTETPAIILSAARKGPNVEISVRDNGRGFDYELLRKKARELGYVPEGTPAGKELHTIVFEDGITSAETASHVSGRGIGMGIVRKTVKELHGTMSIVSEHGVGTSITLSIPLMVSILDGLLTKTGDHHYIFNVQHVEECIDLTREYRDDILKTGSIGYREGTLQCAVPEDIFPNLKSSSDSGIIVVLNSAGKKSGVIVDHIIGRREFVMKPVPSPMSGHGIAGSTILGTGEVALIIDIEFILDRHTRKGIH